MTDRFLQMLLQVNGLDSLVKALDVEVKELRQEKDRALQRKTLRGHLKNSLGYALSFYCLVRYLASLPCAAF